jgi:hypothetical protein
MRWFGVRVVGSPRAGLFAVALLSVIIPACRRGSPAGAGLYPVSGTVTIDGRPVAASVRVFGKVWFHPDATKGNSGTTAVVGHIDEHGRYQLGGEGGGAPAGWYRVTVVVAETVNPENPTARRRSLTPDRYGRPETSGVAVEVVADPAPGAYDLRLAR